MAPKDSVDNDLDNTQDRKFNFGIPFVGAVSRYYKKKISGLIKEHLKVDISPYFKTCKVSSYFSLKSKTPFGLKARVVYKFPCLSDSDVVYIGQTKRHIVTRAKEHVTPKVKPTSEIKNHIFKCETCKKSQLSENNFSILKQCDNEFTCRVAEALCIKKLRPRLNKHMFTHGQSYVLRVF